MSPSSPATSSSGKSAHASATPLQRSGAPGQTAGSRASQSTGPPTSWSAHHPSPSGSLAASPAHGSQASPRLSPSLSPPASANSGQESQSTPRPSPSTSSAEVAGVTDPVGISVEACLGKHRADVACIWVAAYVKPEGCLRSVPSGSPGREAASRDEHGCKPRRACPRSVQRRATTSCIRC